MLAVGLWKMHIAIYSYMFGSTLFLVGIRGVTLYLPSCGLLPSLQFIFTHFLYWYRHNETLPYNLCYNIIRKFIVGTGSLYRHPCGSTSFLFLRVLEYIYILQHLDSTSIPNVLNSYRKLRKIVCQINFLSFYFRLIRLIAKLRTACW